MNEALLLAACGFAVAATVQAATGFGFALIAGPVIFALIDPAAAVGLMLVLAESVNLLVLFAERRKPQVDWAAVRPALVAAIPGLPVGALAVRLLPAGALRLVVAAVVCAAVAWRVAGPRRAAGREEHRMAAIAAGFSVGLLTTSTTTNGPPLAIWLTARGLDPATLRDTVTVLFGVLDVAGLVVLVAVVGDRPVLAHAGWLLPLLAVCVAGHALGRLIFQRLPRGHHERIVLGLAVAAALGSVAAAGR